MCYDSLISISISLILIPFSSLSSLIFQTGHLLGSFPKEKNIAETFVIPWLCSLNLLITLTLMPLLHECTDTLNVCSSIPQWNCDRVTGEQKLPVLALGIQVTFTHSLGFDSLSMFSCAVDIRWGQKFPPIYKKWKLKHKWSVYLYISLINFAYILPYLSLDVFVK